MSRSQLKLKLYSFLLCVLLRLSRFSCQGPQPKGSKHADNKHSGRSCYGFSFSGSDLVEQKIVFYNGEASQTLVLSATGAYHAKDALIGPLEHQRSGTGLTLVGLGQQKLQPPMPKIPVAS